MTPSLRPVSEAVTNTAIASVLFIIAWDAV